VSERVLVAEGRGWFQARLRLVPDAEMGELFEVAVRCKGGGQEGAAAVEQQVLRGLVEDHEVTASGDVLYLRGVILAPPRTVHLSPSSTASSAGASVARGGDVEVGGEGSPAKSETRRQLGHDAWSPTVTPTKSLWKEEEARGGETEGRRGEVRRRVNGHRPGDSDGVRAESSFMFARAEDEGVLDLVFLPTAETGAGNLRLLEEWVASGSLPLTLKRSSAPADQPPKDSGYPGAERGCGDEEEVDWVNEELGAAQWGCGTGKGPHGVEKGGESGRSMLLGWEQQGGDVLQVGGGCKALPPTPDQALLSSARTAAPALKCARASADASSSIEGTAVTAAQRGLKNGLSGGLGSWEGAWVGGGVGGEGQVELAGGWEAHPKEAVWALAFGGGCLFSGSHGGVIKQWNAAQGWQCTREVQVHKEAVLALAWADGLLVSGSAPSLI